MYKNRFPRKPFLKNQLTLFINERAIYIIWKKICMLAFLPVLGQTNRYLKWGYFTCIYEYFQPNVWVQYLNLPHSDLTSNYTRNKSKRFWYLCSLCAQSYAHFTRSHHFAYICTWIVVLFVYSRCMSLWLIVYCMIKIGSVTRWQSYTYNNNGVSSWKAKLDDELLQSFLLCSSNCWHLQYIHQVLNSSY